MSRMDSGRMEVILASQKTVPPFTVTNNTFCFLFDLLPCSLVARGSE